MSNKQLAVKPETAVIQASSFYPINDVPDKAPAPVIDLSNPLLSFDDVLPANFFSMERLTEWLEERQAESRILNVTGCSVEFVYDPEKGIDTGEWKPCLSFEETDTMLVINVTRGQQLKKMTGSPFLKDWAQVGQVAIKPGIGNGKAQIVFAPIPGTTKANGNGRHNGKTSEMTDEEMNEALFS